MGQHPKSEVSRMKNWNLRILGSWKLEATEKKRKARYGFPFAPKLWYFSTSYSCWVVVVSTWFNCQAQVHWDKTSDYAQKIDEICAVYCTKINQWLHYLHMLFVHCKAWHFVVCSWISSNWIGCCVSWSSSCLYHSLLLHERVNKLQPRQCLLQNPSTGHVIFGFVGGYCNGFPKHKRNHAKLWFGHSHFALLFVLKALRQRKSVLVAKDKSCQGYRFRDEMTSITVLTRHRIIINYIWTMIEIWLSVWWDMKPWMNQYANAQLANGLFIFPKSVLCSWCSGTVFNLSSVDTFLQSQSDSWVNDEAAKHVWWRFFFNHEHRVKHVEIWLRQGKETPRLILGGCRCSFLAFVGGIHWWDSHFGNDKDFSGPFQVSSILIVTMTVNLLCFLYIFQHPNENKKLLRNILYTCINM